MFERIKEFFNFKLDRSNAILRINKAVDNFAKTLEFQALSDDKKKAILSLKNIVPAKMPSEFKEFGNIKNAIEHFKGKKDEKERNFFLKLYQLTKNESNIELEIKANNDLRKEFIKAFEHSNRNDLYYIAITKINDDDFLITGIPTTQIRKVINDIVKSEKVARCLGEIFVLAEPTKSHNPQLTESNSTTNSFNCQDQNENFKDKIMKKFEQGISERKENTQKALNLDLVKDLKAKPNSSDDLNDIVDEVKSKEADSVEYKQGAIKDFTTLLENKSLTHADDFTINSQTSQEINQNNLGDDKFKKPPRP